LAALLLPVVAAGVWVDFVDGWGAGAGAGSAVAVLLLGAFELLGAAGAAGVVVGDAVEAPLLTPPW
jgi:hypothetical protein